MAKCPNCNKNCVEVERTEEYYLEKCPNCDYTHKVEIGSEL